MAANELRGVSRGFSRRHASSRDSAHVTYVVYGLKMESKEDLALLHRIVSHVFAPATFFTPSSALSLTPADAPFAAASAGGAVLQGKLQLPAADTEDVYSAWVDGLPPTCPPQWLGLASGEDRARFTREAAVMLSDAVKLMN
eukprot:TRINITY_DN10177_c0_g1_i4.p2 TRINITY_DN10177_c0_g1~~TRINITY_DN10177_c0_g1_i4.p2  ORF type:complete len:142 (+),score=0.51 TRINITY_DN10177_c0_g1_i4:318-743(+)